MPLEPTTINKIMWSIPNILCLIGSRHEDEWNGMTQSWVTQVAMEPVLIAISVDAKAVTNKLIRASRSFSVNIWSRSDTRPFVKFSKPATKDGMALNGRTIIEKVTGAPIFEDAIAYLDCTLWETVGCGSHDLFIGEVVDAGIPGGDVIGEVARMEDTRMKYGGVKRGGH